jgi:hypothetical protein
MKPEIKAQNVRIAGFMGFTLLTENVYRMVGGPIEGEEVYLGDLVSTKPLDTYEHDGQIFLRNNPKVNDYHYLGNYHKSLDDLSYVIKEIRKRQPKREEYKPTHFFLEYPFYVTAIDEALLTLDLDLLNKEVLKFINWYYKYKDEKDGK